MAPPETFLLNFILSLSLMRDTGNIGMARVEKKFTLNPTKMLVDEEYARDEVEDMVEAMDVPYVPIIENKVVEICRHIYEGRASRMDGALHIASIYVSVHQGFVRDVSGEFDNPHGVRHDEFVVGDDYNDEEEKEATEEDKEKKAEEEEKKAEEEETKDETPK